MIVDIQMLGGFLGVVITLGAMFNWCFLAPLRKMDGLLHVLENLKDAILRFEGTIDNILKSQADIDKRLIVVETEQRAMWHRVDDLKEKLDASND